MSKLKLTIEYDQDVDNPVTEDGNWRLYSFNRRHVNFKHPNEFFSPMSIGLRRKLKVGTAFVLSYFEHGQCAWMLANDSNKSRYPDWQWDGTSFAGILIWDEPVSNMGAKTYEGRQKDAKSFLEYYTNWCNGNCYYFRIEDDDGNDIDSGGGFIGEDGLFEAIQENTEGYSEDDIEVVGDAAWLTDHHSIVPEKKKELANA